jgi:hypothetical protein
MICIYFAVYIISAFSSQCPCISIFVSFCGELEAMCGTAVIINQYLNCYLFMCELCLQTGSKFVFQAHSVFDDVIELQGKVEHSQVSVTC